MWFIYTTLRPETDMQIAVQEDNNSWKVFAFNSVAPRIQLGLTPVLEKGSTVGAWPRFKDLFPSKSQINLD